MFVRTGIGAIALAGCLLFVSAAWAGECRVVVTEEGAPSVGVMVDARSADGATVGPVQTDEGGNATLTGQATEYKVRVQGMDAGSCTGFLMVDLGALKAQHNPGASGSEPPVGGGSDGGSGSGSDGGSGSGSDAGGTGAGAAPPAGAGGAADEVGSKEHKEKKDKEQKDKKDKKDKGK